MRQLGNFCSAWINDSQGGSIAEGLLTWMPIRVTFSGVCSCCENKVCIGNFSYAVGHSTASKAAARPATVGACQRRAQWSILLVPSTALANLFMR